MSKRLLIVCSLIFVFACKETDKKEADPDAEMTTADTPEKEEFPYQFSIAQWSFHVPIQKGEMDAMDFAQRSRELGFDIVEYVDQLYTLDSTLTYQEGVMKLAMEWKAKNEEFNIKPGLIMIDRAGELADPDEAKRAEAIRMHKIWVDAAVAIGSPAIRVNLFGLNDPQAWHDASVASLKDLGAYAAEKNIMILPENHAQRSNNPEYLVPVIKEVNLPSVGILPDFGNFCIMREKDSRWGPAPCVEEYDRYKGIEMLIPYAGGVSAKSYAFDENGDETTVDYYKMMQIVKDSDFSGVIGIEFEDEVTMDPSVGILATKDLLIKAYNQAK